MGMIDPLIEELKQEAATTRKHLERAPEKDFDWKPHEKSMSLGALCSHLAESSAWTAEILEKDGVDIDPSSYQPWVAKSRAELLEKFDANLATSLQVLKDQPDEKLMRPWTMRVGGKEVFTMPRLAVLRSFILSHVIHHRGQLGVYLRLRDVPLPAVYGPTADEQEPG
jgi:uncharacterized damage-inducible protein DinB